MHEKHGFEWISLIPGLGHAPSHVVTAILVALVLIVFGTFAAMKARKAVSAANEEALIPEEKLSVKGFFELLAEGLYQLTEMVLGKHEAERMYPMIGTLFLFIFACNMIGLIPGFLPPTSNLNTTLALGAFVFIYYNYTGLKEHGLAYFKHFLGPVLWLSPLMLVIELASHIFRPLSLGLRLRGNIDGDHVVLSVFSGLVPYLLPVIFYGLGVFVAFVQAFVFCLLTMVYISLSTAHDH